MIDLIGRRFTYLVVLERRSHDKKGNYYWLCRCDCGILKIIRGTCLKSGNTKSCGCFKLSLVTKHGHSTRDGRSSTYYTWNNMVDRCRNPINKDYPNYGGRGICVCSRWAEFKNFLEDMGPKPAGGFQLDRIDNNGDYCLSNCRWTTSKINNRNRRNNILMTHDGITQTLSAWAEKIGIPYGTLYWRLHQGWPTEMILQH